MQLRREFRAAGALAVLVLAAIVGAALPAVAAADDAALLPASAASVAVDLQSATRRLDTVTRSLASTDADLETADLSVALTQSQLAGTTTMLQQVQSRVRARAVVAYQRHGTASASPLSVARVEDLDAADQYGGAAAGIDTGALDELTRTEAMLHQALDKRTASRDDIAARRSSLIAERDQLTEAAEQARRQLSAWGAVPVMGESTLSADQLSGWFQSTGAVPRLAPGTTMDDIARFFVEEGSAEHVRGDLAFAQAIIETGSFGVAAGNNFSGIGVCDSCTGGYGFSAPRDGVRAQIQLLRNYADPTSRAAKLAYPASPALYGGDADKAARLYDSFFLKGKAPLWNLMGNGNWATDPVYAPKVIDLYARMVAWASTHPAGAPPP